MCSEVYCLTRVATKLEAKIEGRQMSKKAAREARKLVAVLHLRT